MQVATGIEMLELSAVMMNGPGSLYPTLFWDQKEAVLVDAGLPGMVPQFLEAIKQAGVPSVLHWIQKVLVAVDRCQTWRSKSVTPSIPCRDFPSPIRFILFIINIRFTKH